MKKRLKIKKRYLFCVLVIALWLGINNDETPFEESGIVGKVLAELVLDSVSDFIMPIAGLSGQGGNGEKAVEKQSFFLTEFPIIVQAMPTVGTKVQENEGEMTEAGMEEDILAGMLAENRNGEGIPREDAENVSEEMMQGETIQENTMDVSANLEGNVPETGFHRAVKTNSFDYTALSEYQTLVSTFYTIDAGTTAGSNELNLEKLRSKDMTISKEDPGPQILIYHTHSLEAFADSVPGERSQTIVGVGDRLTEILTEEYGYSVLHHTQEYDTTRDDAYANSLPGIKKVLEENPSIQVVIDLHRDAGVEGVRRAITLDGRPTATFMLFNGLSRTRKTGDIDYLYNPYLEDNLAFSFQMQVKAGEYYPGLTRKIYLKAYRYNMHLMPKTLLIELGDSNNTVEEAMNTCDPLAHILDMVLSGEG